MTEDLTSDFKDFITVLEVNEEIQADPNRPVIKRLNPLDEIEVELTLLEADNLVELYFEQYRSRFAIPEYFEVLREAYRKKYREHIRTLVDWARSLPLKGSNMNTEVKRNLEQRLADDGWDVECESPLEIRNINGAFLTNQAAQNLLDFYKKGGRYGKQ